MRGLHLTEPHCDLRKLALGFGFMNDAMIIGSLATSPGSMRDRVAAHREADSRAKITRKCI